MTLIINGKTYEAGELIAYVQKLEKRCANYEMQLSKMEKGTCDIYKETEKDKKIAYLEKENAELKDKLNKIERKCKFNFVDLLHDVENESKQEEQLTKAKELLAKWVELFKPKGGNIPPTPIQVDTEQFLNSEVEK